MQPHEALFLSLIGH